MITAWNMSMQCADAQTNILQGRRQCGACERVQTTRVSRARIHETLTSQTNDVQHDLMENVMLGGTDPQSWFASLVLPWYVFMNPIPVQHWLP
ncbi:hypothetical protein Y032_0165g12 [Ancylostoma ceylanicum]|uniref:Uncharacterized protein n=1 Tax=Ancylostoma ceylanicum TaxID=53326 RepID=A0A016SX46_9BILA|nr:hypothetical protein Y032_0165g12 [Ancylostoma ceylanicum]